VIADAVTGKPLSATCATLIEAARIAAAIADGCTVWQENVDQRGRSIGPPVLLPISPHGGRLAQ
jgi:hypothetical protein